MQCALPAAQLPHTLPLVPRHGGGRQPRSQQGAVCPSSSCRAAASSKKQQEQQPADSILLPAGFWQARQQVLGRSVRSRHNQRAQLQQVRQQELAALQQLGPEAVAAYEAAGARLRRAAALEERGRLAHALKYGPRVVVDCSHSQQHCDTAPTGNAPARQHQHGHRHRCSSSSSSSSMTCSSVTSSSVATGRPHGLATQEVRSLAKQLELCVAANRRARQPVALTLSSWTGQLAAYAHDRHGATGWRRGAQLHKEHFLELQQQQQQQQQPQPAGRSSVVLLSPDAPDPLPDDFDPTHACLVIGGIVDRTVVKGLTLAVAADHGLAARRLPIAEHAAALGLDFPGANLRPALSVSDVFVALLEFFATRDWSTALAAGLPKRRRRRHGQGLQL